MYNNLVSWYDRYNEYTGCNGDGLAEGLIKAMTSTGIVTDGYEVNEVQGYERFLGRDSVQWTDEEIRTFPGPVTRRMYSELLDITGARVVDEELCINVSQALAL